MSITASMFRHALTAWSRKSPDAADVLAIIPAFCNPQQLKQCLQALNQQTVAERIRAYVRDNSDDNIYYTKALNEGMLEGLRGPQIRYFLILTQDCYLYPDAVQRLLEVMQQYPEAGICAPFQVDSAQTMVTWGGSLQAFPTGQCLGAPYSEEIKEKTPFSVPWADGAAFLARREMVERVGIMDDNMRFIASDSDYSFTARARGWQVLAVPAAMCTHDRGQAQRPTHRNIISIMHADTSYFMFKWVTGALYRRLETEEHIGSGPPARNLEQIRAEGEAHLQWLAKQMEEWPEA